MTPAKRIFDIIVALGLLAFLLPVMLVVAGLILLLDGHPIFYLAERMKTPQQGFTLIKFRSMRVVSGDKGVSGGDKTGRITRTGHFLRRSRLDEVPQIFNVLRGDISFVGPRPPLRQYVERFPAIYAKVLRSRPGITGIASIYFHGHEERLLARSRSAQETDDIYCRACIPRKARLDELYQAGWNPCFDILLMLRTVFKSLR